MNIKGLGKRCSFSVIEKPLWGVPEQRLPNCTGEMTRMKGRAGWRVRLHLFCCPSAVLVVPPFSWQAYPPPTPLLSQVWTPNGKPSSLSPPQDECLDTWVFWLNWKRHYKRAPSNHRYTPLAVSLYFVTLQHTLLEQFKYFFTLNICSQHRLNKRAFILQGLMTWMTCASSVRLS